MSKQHARATGGLILFTVSLLTAGVVLAGSADDAARHYPLSMTRMQSYFNATLNLTKAAARDPKLQETLSANGDEMVDQIIARFDGAPAAKKALAGAGLTTRQYVYIQTAYTTAAFGAAYQAQTHGQLDSTYDAANVAFYKAHQKELLAMQAKMQEQFKAAAGAQ